DRPLQDDPDSPSWYRYADNLAYRCRDVTEGHRALERARQLLAPVGLSPKGADGPPVDLRTGGEVQLLGFTLSYAGDRLHLGLGQEAWDGLDQGLAAAREA